jgi:hypothetical protein
MEGEILGMTQEHKVRLLELGAPGQLLIAGDIDEVLPLDDAELLEQAKPITPDGRVQFDSATLAARHDVQVRGDTG